MEARRGRGVEAVLRSKAGGVAAQQEEKMLGRQARQGMESLFAISTRPRICGEFEIRS
jgi:hypothetical protein